MVKPGFGWLLPFALALIACPPHAWPSGLTVNYIAEDVPTAGMLQAGHCSDRRSGQIEGVADRDLPAHCQDDGQRVLISVSELLAYLRNQPYARRITWLHRALGIPANYARRHGLPLQPEAQGLIAAGPDIYQRKQRLLPAAAAAWQAMVAAAAADGVELQLVSAFRPVNYQASILRRKLQHGQAIDDILRVSAAPGFSEHHSGRAVDLTTPGYAVLEEEFEHSAAFAWLSRRAAKFGFRMSYPRGNPHGVAYEPWHWTWQGGRQDRYTGLGIQDGLPGLEDFPASTGGAGATASK